MKTHKIVLIVSALFSIFSFISALLIYLCDCNSKLIFFYDVLIGFFASGLLISITSLISYLIESRKFIDRMMYCVALYQIDLIPYYGLFMKDKNKEIMHSINFIKQDIKNNKEINQCSRQILDIRASNLLTIGSYNPFKKDKLIKEFMYRTAKINDAIGKIYLTYVIERNPYMKKEIKNYDDDIEKAIKVISRKTDDINAYISCLIKLSKKYPLNTVSKETKH